MCVLNIDNPAVSLMKNQAKSLSFSVVIWSEDGLQIMPRFRLVDGCIQPPCNYSAQSKQYYPVYFCSPGVAGKIYQLIETKDWVKTYGLPALKSLELATAALVMTRERAARLAPETYVKMARGPKMAPEIGPLTCGEAKTNAHSQGPVGAETLTPAAPASVGG